MTGVRWVGVETRRRWWRPTSCQTRNSSDTLRRTRTNNIHEGGPLWHPTVETMLHIHHTMIAIQLSQQELCDSRHGWWAFWCNPQLLKTINGIILHSQFVYTKLILSSQLLITSNYYYNSWPIYWLKGSALTTGVLPLTSVTMPSLITSIYLTVCAQHNLSAIYHLYFLSLNIRKIGRAILITFAELPPLG